MTYEYKEHEIYARVWHSGSALYEINSRGKITDEVEGCRIDHDDEQIVWYEVEAIDPEAGTTTMYVELRTLQDAKDIVDKSLAYSNQLEGND